MANKVTYSSLKLKVNTDINTFDFNGSTIEVLKYLPFRDKYDLIMVSLQKAEENGIYNQLIFDMYFHLYLVFLYSNVTFTDKQREDEVKIYDCLCSNGFMNAFLQAIDEDEYNMLLDMAEAIMTDRINYDSTAASIFKKLITDLPKNAEIADSIVKGFDPEQYERIKNFARAAGMPESN